MAMKKKQSQQQQEMKIKIEKVVKVEVEEKQNLNELKSKYDGVLHDGVLQEKDDEINKLKKSLDLLNGDLVRERQIVSDMKKKLDVQAEESRKKRVYELKLIDDFEKNLKKLREKLTEEYKERDEAIEGLLVEKGLIEQKLVDSRNIIEELKREKQQIAVEKNQIEKNRDDLLLKLDSGRRKKFKEISEEGNVFNYLETAVSSLEKQSKVVIDAYKHLESEVRSLKDNLKRVEAEKSEIQKQLKNALSELAEKTSKDLMEGVDADKGKQHNLRKRKIG